MRYTEFADLPVYVDSQSGSAIRIIILEVGDDGSTPVFIGHSLTGVNWNEPIETLPVEEAGAEGVNEIVVGRIGPVTANVEGIWSPELNDRLPWRGDFLGAGNGREYLILEVLGDKRVGNKLPVNVFEGARLSGTASSHGARGLKQFSLPFIARWRWPGAEWAKRIGNPNL